MSDFFWESRGIRLSRCEGWTVMGNNTHQVPKVVLASGLRDAPTNPWFRVDGSLRQVWLVSTTTNFGHTKNMETNKSWFLLKAHQADFPAESPVLWRQETRTGNQKSAWHVLRIRVFFFSRSQKAQGAVPWINCKNESKANWEQRMKWRSFFSSLWLLDFISRCPYSVSILDAFYNPLFFYQCLEFRQKVFSSSIWKFVSQFGYQL